MKSMEYMKDVSFSDMEKIASDAPDRVPTDLESSLEELTDSLEALRRLNREERHPSVRWTSIAAGFVLLAGLAFSLSNRPRLKDTFDDPFLAYAEAEKALMLISDAMSTGAEKSNEAVEAFETPKEIIDKIIR